jgi:hypothetical protein
MAPRGEDHFQKQEYQTIRRRKDDLNQVLKNDLVWPAERRRSLTDAWGLKKGMKVEAQRVTEVPETVVAQEVHRTGSAPPPPAPRQDVPILVVIAQPAPPPIETAAAEPTPTKLPKTASDLPLIGLLGAFFCVLSLMTMAIRTIGARYAASRR